MSRDRRSLTTQINPQNYSEVQKAQIEAEAKAEEALRFDFKAAFGTEWGQRVLAHLIEWSALFAVSYVPGDTHGTAFNEGIKNTVRYILSLADRNNLDEVKILWNYSAPPQGR